MFGFSILIQLIKAVVIHKSIGGGAVADQYDREHDAKKNRNRCRDRTDLKKTRARDGFGQLLFVADMRIDQRGVDLIDEIKCIRFHTKYPSFAKESFSSHRIF